MQKGQNGGNGVLYPTGNYSAAELNFLRIRCMVPETITSVNTFVYCWLANGTWWYHGWNSVKRYRIHQQISLGIWQCGLLTAAAVAAIGVKRLVALASSVLQLCMESRMTDISIANDSIRRYHHFVQIIKSQWSLNRYSPAMMWSALTNRLWVWIDHRQPADVHNDRKNWRSKVAKSWPNGTILWLQTF